MRKVWFSLIFFLIVFAIPSQRQSIQEGVSPSPSLSPSQGGGGAGEWDNIDTFEVHPGSGRWDTTNVGYSAVCENSLLNLSDTGDGTDDNYELVRGLSSLDSKLTIRFRISATGSTSDSKNRVMFDLEDSGSNAQMRLWFLYIKDNSRIDTRITFSDIYGTSHTEYLPADEDLLINTWYIYRLDYDILRDTYRFRLYGDNGTKLWDYDNYDVSPNPASISEYTSLQFSIFANTKSSGHFQQLAISYVEAKFKEREWVQFDTPTDINWLVDTPYTAHGEDTLSSETSMYYLVIPYLDTVSGEITFDFDWPTMAHGDELHFWFQVHNVDPTDGSIHEVHRVHMFGGDNSGTNWVQADLENGSTTQFSQFVSGVTGNPSFTFAINMYNDRSEIGSKVAFWPDRTDEDTVYIGKAHTWVDASLFGGMAAESMEFVLHMEYEIDLATNTELGMSVHNFDYKSRESFAGINDDPGTPLPQQNSGGGVNKGANDPLSILFQTLATAVISGFQTIIDLTLVPAIDIISSVLTTVIDVSLGLIEGAVGAVGEAIATVSGVVGSIWGVIETFVTDVIDRLVFMAGDFIDAIIIFLGTVITGLLELSWALWYGLWAAVGLEGIFDIGDVLFTGFLQFITNLPQFIMDWVNFLQVISFIFAILGFIWIFILPIAIGDTTGGFMEKMIEHMFTDLSGGAGVAGFQVPIPFIIPWSLVVIFSLLSDTIFYGFFG